jgi:serine/threonine protein kinase
MDLETSHVPTLGDVIRDKYRLDSVLGRGGMSMVYSATELESGRVVAVKVLSRLAMMVPEFVERLRREARATACLRSDHVVRVLEAGELEEGGVPYLVMERLSGADLAATLARRGPLPVAMACQCIIQVCDALAEAHAMGIVHRDLKPANLFLVDGHDGTPWIKVLDFGISRPARSDALGALTDPGIVLGTPGYMAPEQMEGVAKLDARADVWALGTILYELLTGEPRCTGESLAQVFLAVVRCPPPRPSALRRDVPRELDAILARCLALEPSRRYASAAELAKALAPFARPSARARQSVRARARALRDRIDARGIVAAAALAIVAAAAIATVVYAGGAAAGAPGRADRLPITTPAGR